MSKTRKIFRRLNLFFKLFPNVIPAYIFEHKKHPWEIVYDRLFFSSNYSENKSLTYIKKYFNCKVIDTGLIIDFDNFEMFVETEKLSDYDFLHSLLVLYYDIVYTGKTKYNLSILLSEGSYEQGGVKLEHNDVVIDCGANVGFFSFYAAKKIGTSGEVYSFEPISDVSDILIKSRKSANIKNIMLAPFAVGSQVGKITFNFSKDNIGGSSQDSVGTSIEVSQTSIDSYIFQNNIKCINFVKMDIEGMEPEALRGAEQAIKKWKPKLAICTYHDPKHPELLEKIIKDFDPSYNIYHSSHKLFAW